MNDLRSKVTAVNRSALEQSAKSWLSVVNALSGVWGWTQTSLFTESAGDYVEAKRVTWRVTPGGCEARFSFPSGTTNPKLQIPFALPSAGGERPSTIVHAGGEVSYQTPGAWGTPSTCQFGRGAELVPMGSASAGDVVVAKIFFSYMEG